MDERLKVHSRIPLRHPELTVDNVKAAWESCIISTPRINRNPDEYLALGFDSKGRLLEMAAVRSSTGEWLIYHATTPPSDRTFRELGIERGK